MENVKLSTASFYSYPTSTSSNPWSGDDVDKLEFGVKDYNKVVETCRFFYKKDPIASSTINKLVEIGINDIILGKSKLSENEMRIFYGIKPQIIQFCEAMALEYLISGFVIPEIKFGRVKKTELEIMGIKKYDSLILPVSMWLRDPQTVKIKSPILSDKPSYFYKVPESVVYFIQNQGKYSDGTSDPDLWAELLQNYPDFITAIRQGKREFLLDNDLIFRRKPQVNDPYPIPYLFPALENLKHKRNLRRMDYAIASRVIGAIQLFNLGSDEYPVTAEDQEEQFESIRQQMYYRDNPNIDIERIFQLFANHTLKITWVYPDTSALLNEQKYNSINEDIIYALGFPRILITGETAKTGTSDPQYAMMSPAKTMESFRNKILEVVRYIIHEIAVQNNLKTEPVAKFKPLRLFDYQTLLKSLSDLYSGGNISRTTYADELGYSWDDETDLREKEQKVLMDKELGEFAPKPFSNQPGMPGQDPTQSPGKKNPSQGKPQVSDPKKTSNNENGNN